MLNWLICAIAIFGLWLSAVPPVDARLQQQVEAPGQILYQSRHALRDSNRDSWQVVLFKRVEDGDTTALNLRLVGFPGRAEFQHPQDLGIAVGDRVWQATDLFATEAPAANVGQFDLSDLLLQLPDRSAVELSLPVAGAPTLRVPAPVIVEWKVVASFSGE